MEIMKNNMKHDFMIDEILFKRTKNPQVLTETAPERLLVKYTLKTF